METERRSPIRNPGLQIVLAATLLLGLSIGAIEVALPGLAVREGSRAATGILLGLWSIGSLIGGLTYGSRLVRTQVTVRYAGLMLLVAATTAPLMFVGSLAAAFPVSLLAGVGFAPLMACQYTLVGALADRRTVTEAFAWTSTALVSGIAGGNAIGGVLIQGGEIARAFAFGCLTQVAGALIALTGRRRLASAVARREPPGSCGGGEFVRPMRMSRFGSTAMRPSVLEDHNGSRDVVPHNNHKALVETLTENVLMIAA